MTEQDNTAIELRGQMNDAIRDLSIKLSASMFVTGKVSPKLYEYENELEETIMQLIQQHTEAAVEKAKIDVLENLLDYYIPYRSLLSNAKAKKMRAYINSLITELRKETK